MSCRGIHQIIKLVNDRSKNKYDAEALKASNIFKISLSLANIKKIFEI